MPLPSYDEIMADLERKKELLVQQYNEISEQPIPVYNYSHMTEQELLDELSKVRQSIVQLEAQ